MNIRQKILTYFSILSISLVGIAFLLIYILSSNYRMEEFQQRIKDKTTTTLRFLVEIKQIDHDLLQTMDKNTINHLYKEKILLFNEKKELIYSSLDDTKITYPANILNKLSATTPVIEYEEEGFDVVGIFIEFENKNYYGVAKAYDIFGLRKLHYLGYILILIFVVISSIILLSSFWLSKQISFSLNQIAAQLKEINIESQDRLVEVPESKDEINLLASRFNELMKRLHDSFAYQKHAVHHISHELKTPIAILVSNFERMEQETDIHALKRALQNQKKDTKNLSDIINALLEIAKVESGSNMRKEEVRADEVIFDVLQDMKIINEEFQFEVDVDDKIENEQGLTVLSNKKLLRLVVANLLGNCIQYSDDHKARIRIYNEKDRLCMEFINHGKVIRDSEKHYLFQHFFRGENSKGKSGFGLGLVLISKIISLHQGQIVYESVDHSINIFRVKLPLR